LLSIYLFDKVLKNIKKTNRNHDNTLFRDKAHTFFYLTLDDNRCGSDFAFGGDSPCRRQLQPGKEIYV
jgi:hypothetical protein